MSNLNGFRGVTVFFVVSGLLITTLAIREESREGALSLRRFYIRRCFRIFPLYYIVLLTYVLVVTVLSNPSETKLFFDALPYYLVYLQELPPLIGINGAPFEQSWSLGFEEKFYLVWPLLGFVIARGSNQLRTLIVVAISLALSLISFAYPNSLVAGLTFSYVPILIGCGLAILLSTNSRLRTASLALGRGSIVLLGVVAVAMIALPDSAIGQVTFSLIVAIALVGLVADSPGARLLSHPWLVGLGRISYGFYLVHVMVISVVYAKLPGPHEGLARETSAALIAFFASVLLAYGLHRAIEVPLIQYGKRMIGARPRQTANASAR